MLAVLQLDMDQRKTVDQKSHIEATVSASTFRVPGRRVLIDHFIDRRAACFIRPVQRHKMKRFVIPLDMDHRLAIFARDPDSCIIEGRKRKLVLHLLKLGIRQGSTIKGCLVIIFQNELDIRPKGRLIMNIRPVSPLRLTHGKLVNQVLFDCGFEFCHNI